MEQVKGVNLGNWLVLEKWMSPALFAGTNAEDEYYLPFELDKDVYEARIKMHRSEYITERDFLKIASKGLNAVRIPVPYFVFGDRAPFIGCIEELDLAFAWAKKYGLKILLDLHTAPDSQNGFDNGGISGVCKWAQEPEEVEFVLTVLERLAQRYGNHPALWGIEVLNEPITELEWKVMDMPDRYPARDVQKAKGSKPIEIEFIRSFYIEAYHRLRAYLPKEKCIVFHDAFMQPFFTDENGELIEVQLWDDFMKDEQFENIVLDSHLYLFALEGLDHPKTPQEFADSVKKRYESYIKQCNFPVIVGEWCLFNPKCIQLEHQMAALDPQSDAFKEAEKKRNEIYLALSKSLLKAWDQGTGFFFWNYKLLIDGTNDENWIGWNAWDFDRCVDMGWMPKAY